MSTHLEVVMQCNDVFVTFGDLFQDVDLIPDLVDREHRRGDARGKSTTDHMFTALHEFLVDNFAGIIFACLDVYGLLHDGVSAAPECLSRAILQGVLRRRKESTAQRDVPGMELSVESRAAYL